MTLDDSSINKKGTTRSYLLAYNNNNNKKNDEIFDILEIDTTLIIKYNKVQSKISRDIVFKKELLL